MGMESYYVDILPQNVKVFMDGNTRKLDGVSNVYVSEFVNKLQKIEHPIRQKNENIFIIDEAIQLQLIIKNQYIQAMTLQGCFAWFEEGLEVCFSLAKFIKNNITEVNINILNEEVYLEDVDSFKKVATELYREKFEYFQKYLADFKAKVLPSDFYNYRKKYLKEKNGIVSRIRNSISNMIAPIFNSVLKYFTSHGERDKSNN